MIRWRGYPPLLPLLILVFLPCIFLFKAIFLGHSLWPVGQLFSMPPWSEHFPKEYVNGYNHLLWDVAFNFYTRFHLVFDGLKNGILPLWNPYILCGAPLFANSTGFLFPFNIVYLFLPIWYAFTVVVFFKLFFAGLFMYLYMRSISINKTGSILSSISFMFCGYIVVWLGHNHTYTAILLPLLLLLTDKLIKKERLWYVAILSLSVGVSLLGAHYETTFNIIALTGIYLTYRLFTLNSSSYYQRFRPLVLFIISLIIGAGIASVQLIPSWEYISQSSILEVRSRQGVNIFSFQLFPQFLASLKTVIAYLIPDFYGNPVDNNEWGYPFSLGSYVETSGGYVGVLPFVLAIFALLLNWKNSPVRFFAIAGLISLGLTYKVPVLTGILDSLPVFSKLNHTRLVLIYCFSMSVLAGCGMDFIATSIETTSKKRLYILLGSLLVLSAIFAITLNHSITTGMFSDVTIRYGLNPYISEKICLFLLWFTLGLTAIFLHTKEILTKSLFQAVVILLVAVELLLFAIKFWPTIDSKDIYPTTPSIEFLKKDKDIFRVFGAGDTLLGNTSGVYGIQDIRGHDPVILKDYERFITGKIGDRRFYYQGGLLPRFSKMMNVKYIMVPSGFQMPHNHLKKVFTGEIDIYMDPSHFPRAFTVPYVKFVSTPDETLKIMNAPGFNPAKEVIITGDRDNNITEKIENIKSIGNSKVNISHYGANYISIEADMKNAGFIVLSDTFFPGWKAYIDGKESKIFRANYLFRSVFLESGKHIIKFRYEPISIKIGFIISLISFLVVVGIIVYSFKRKTKT